MGTTPGGFGRLDVVFANAGARPAGSKHAVGAMAEAARKELHQGGIRVTLISPGNDATPLLRQHPTVALTDDDVARSVMLAVSQPREVAINEILMRHRDRDA